MMKQPNVVHLHTGGGQPRLMNPSAPHARIYAEWRHLDAFKSLSPLQRVILDDILIDFTRVAGNETRLTCKGVMKRYRVGHTKARDAIAGLEDRGWIERIGLSPGPTGQAGGLYRILCLTAQGKPVFGRYYSWMAE